jgi:hypothetical protein
VLTYIPFAERMPTRDKDGSYVVAAYPGGAPFVIHWPTDFEGHTEQPDCMWLQGARIPAVPQPHEVECCCRRKAA